MLLFLGLRAGGFTPGLCWARRSTHPNHWVSQLLVPWECPHSFYRWLRKVKTLARSHPTGMRQSWMAKSISLQCLGSCHWCVFSEQRPSSRNRAVQGCSDHVARCSTAGDPASGRGNAELLKRVPFFPFQRVRWENGISTTPRLTGLSTASLSLGSPKGKLERSILAQVVYLGGGPGKHAKRVGGGETGMGRKQKGPCPQTSNYYEPQSLWGELRESAKTTPPGYPS